MKTVILLRHAKSDWSDEGMRDIDRPLNARGRKDTPLMGEWIAPFAPDLCLCSSARRTCETHNLLGLDIKTEFVDALYLAPAQELLARIRTLPDSAHAVLLIAHNPGIGELANQLVADAPFDADFVRYPTAACAAISFEADQWDQIEAAQGKLVKFQTPKGLKA